MLLQIFKWKKRHKSLEWILIPCPSINLSTIYKRSTAGRNMMSGYEILCCWGYLNSVSLINSQISLLTLKYIQFSAINPRDYIKHRNSRSTAGTSMILRLIVNETWELWPQWKVNTRCFTIHSTFTSSAESLGSTGNKLPICSIQSAPSKHNPSSSGNSFIHSIHAPGLWADRAEAYGLKKGIGSSASDGS